MKRSESSSRLPLNPVQSNPSSNGSAGWIARLKPETSKDRNASDLRALLESLSEQRAPRGDGSIGLMMLLAHGEFEAFVDTFNLIHKLKEDEHPIDQGAYKRTFHLCLPGNWKPSDLPGMLDALTRIQVDKLEVHPPIYGKIEPRLPEAVCAGLAVLLKGGATRLIVDGIPNRPLEIVQALQGSQLQSIKLGGMALNTAELTQSDMKDFETLIEGLAGCTDLKKLVIDHRQLLALHASVAALSTQPHSPKLQQVSMGSSHCVPKDVAPFLMTLRHVSTVTAIEVVTGFKTAPILKDEVLETLRAHPSLQQLTVTSTEDLPWYKDIDQFVPTMLSFATTCPHLTHVALKNADLPKDGAAGSFKEFKQRGGDLEAPGAARAVTEAFAKGFALKSLKFEGLLLTPGVVKALAKELEQNTSIESLDIFGCSLDLESFLLLLEAVKKSKSILNFTISPYHNDLCFLSPDGSIQKFEHRTFLSPDGTPQSFKLKFDENVPEEARAAANKAFARLEGPARNIAVDIEMHQRRMLEPRISDFMTAALLAQPQGASYSFAQAAPMVIRSLAKSDLRTAFRLNEVNKPTVVESAPTTTTSTATTTMATIGTTTTTTTGSTTTTSTAATTTSGLQLTTSLRQ
ncbi:hypothetical protein [Hydrogenophaga sp.]|uniref:hypothetical protein n=1 Tax=Hydrogenophaga sp. TaxID=1904254 RepID=UPI002719D1A5|nr:hypothetical protein [Hydrogenophaga sp.]MDO9434060.1 hypothetical protein [Hydrogenophaga sp.]